MKNKRKKILARVSAVLAVVVLVVVFVLPCFADVTLDEVLEQEEYLNFLYGGDVLNLSAFLYQEGINYSWVTSYVELNSTQTYNGSMGDVAFITALPTERFAALNTGTNMFYLQIYEDDAVFPLIEYNYANVVATEIVDVEISVDADISVTYGVEFYFSNNDYIITFDFVGTPSADYSMFSYYIMGVRVYNPTVQIDIYYDVLPYEFQFSFVQFGDGLNTVPSVLAYQNLFGAVYYPARDLQLNIPQGGGGATEEELQQAYQNGYNEGYDDGTQQTSLIDFITAIFRAPMEFVNNTLDFQIFGIQMATAVKVLITMAIIGVVVTIVWKAVK